jgi:cell division protein FtsL
MDDPTTDDNPLTVEMALEIVGKWETHPGLLMAIFDASRKLRDEVERLRDELQRANDWGNAVKAELQSTQRTLGEHRTVAQEAYSNLYMQWSASQHELEQLRAVVAQNNRNLSGIITRWIKPSTN